MSTKPITGIKKAHANCAGGSDGDIFKISCFSPALKKNFKTPFKPKHTPVHRRNVSRIKIDAVTTIKKFSSCQNLNVLHKDTDFAKCNKSKSCESLETKFIGESNICAIRKTNKIMGDNEHIVVDGIGNKLIKEACTAFLLNAWRHRRQEVAEIKKKITALENQTTDLRVQIMSLWQLLESEKARLAQANLKAMQQHVLAEDASIKNKNLMAMNASQQKELTEISKEILLLRTECNNQKNELIVAKQEIFSLHNQMDKERVKVTKLRDDKKILLDKAQAAEAEAKKKAILLAQNESELKEKEETQMVVLQTLQEKSMQLEGLSAERATIQSELDKKLIENENLFLRIAELEKTIQEKDKEIETLKLTTEKYMVEAVQMKLSTLKAQETDDDWTTYAGKRLMATIIMALIPLVQNMAFP